RQDVDVVRADADKAAAFAKASPLRYVLVAALDHWADVDVDQGSDRKLLRRLLHVARRADPDPWRDRFRHLEIWRQKTDLNNLKTLIDLPRQSPPIIVALARRLQTMGEDPVPLLRSALLAYPRDFW